MIRWIIGIVVGILALALLLTVYLGPDDLNGCDIDGGPTSTKQCVAADAIIAISGGDTNARADEAIRLYRAGWAPKLVFSGAAKDKSGPSNAAAMRTHALSSGVPESAILVEEDSETTFQNAQLTKQVLTDNDIHSVILVTSAYHQRRAGLEFGKIVGSAVTVRNHPTRADSQWPIVWWLTPNGWYLAGSEIAKIVAFYVGSSQ